MIITLSGMFGAGRSTVANLLCARINKYLDAQATTPWYELSFLRKHFSIRKGEQKYRRWSGGDAWEEEAKKRGITIKELSALSKKEPGIHDLVDDRLKEFKPDTDCLVIDALLGYLFVPEGKNHFRVYLDVSQIEGGRRIYEQQQVALRDPTKTKRTDEPNYNSPAEAQEYRHRQLIDIWRGSVIDKYGKLGDKADFLNRHNYDLIINTDHVSAEEVADGIFGLVKNRLKTA